MDKNIGSYFKIEMQISKKKKMLEILDLPVKDKEIFIFPETKETSKSVTSLSVKLLRLRMINIPQNNFTCKSNPDPLPPPTRANIKVLLITSF